MKSKLLYSAFPKSITVVRAPWLGVLHRLLTGAKHCLYINCGCEGLEQSWGFGCAYVLHMCGGWGISSRLWYLVRWGEQKLCSSIAAEMWEHSSARILLPWNCLVCVKTCTDILWCCVNLSQGALLWHTGAFCHAVCCDLIAEMYWRSFVDVFVILLLSSIVWPVRMPGKDVLSSVKSGRVL